ncbi:MAG: CheR family methyltransferase [Geitlerinemataceae cyanobacterium]
MDVSSIEKLLQDQIGLEGGRINSSHIAKVVSDRMSALEQPNFNAYLHRVQTSSQELEALVESIVVPETWFFRDREAFNFMRLYVKYTWSVSHSNKVLRVLSVPCSTGEEPYSIAIALLESGLTPNQFTIDAIDISKIALEKARSALYRENSFRGKDLDFRNRYFKRQDQRYKLYDSIGKNIRFRWGNILQPNFLSDQQRYHIIWCRNLLIYFNRASQKKVFETLDRLLVPEGLLFLGYAEFGTLKSDRLVSVHHPRAFAYRKVVNSISRSRQKTQQKDSTQKVTFKSSTVYSKSKELPTAQKISQLPLAESDLQAARRLANEGKLEAAISHCETYIRRNRTSSEAYLLIGEIEQALGHNDIAEANLRKAIYLEPDCYEALVHLAQLQEQRGDDRSAAIIRQRIQRLLSTSEN